MLATLAIGALLGASVLLTLLPAARPWLIESCRGEERARFWTRFIGLAISFGILVGLLYARVFGDRFLLLDWALEPQEELHRIAVGLRMALQFTGGILVLMCLWAAALDGDPSGK